MATKTITLELDAYERLRAAKRGARESFSSVVRRATFAAEAHTGAAVLEGLEALADGDLPSEEVLAYWEQSRAMDRRSPRLSPSPWDRPDAS